MADLGTIRRLTVSEVAERLRASRRSVLTLVSTGRLRALNVGTGDKRPRWVVDQADLEAFEARRATAPAATRKMSRRCLVPAVPNYFGD